MAHIEGYTRFSDKILGKKAKWVRSCLDVTSEEMAKLASGDLPLKAPNVGRSQAYESYWRLRRDEEYG